MSESDFYKTTPRTFQNILTGHFSEYKKEMELHRELIVTLLLPNLKEADRKKPINKIYPLPWDAAPVKNKPAADPVKFWEEIDKRTESQAKGAPDQPSG